MGTFLGLLAECGYGAAWRVLDAQFIRVDGCERAVPQRRRRLFVVGHLGDAAGPAAVLFERESLCGHPAPRREQGQGTAPTLSARTKGGGGLGTDFDCDGGLVAGVGGGNRSGSIDAACLTARGHKCDFEVETFIAQPIVADVTSTLPAGGNSTGGDRQPGTSAETAATMLIAQPYRVAPNDGAYATGDVTASLTTGTDNAAITLVEPVAHSLRADGFDASEDGTGRGTPLVPVQQPYVIMERGRSGEQSLEYRNDGTADALLTPNGGRGGMGVGAVAFAQNSRDEVRLFGEDGQTVGALGAEPGMKQQCYIAQQWAVRRLTPTECARLMDVPDDFLRITYRGKPAADGPQYKALGNSQARNVMRWLGHGLADVIAAQAVRDQ